MYQCVRRSSSQSQPRIDSVRRKAEPQSQHAQGGASCRSEPKSGLYAVAPWQFDKLDADLVATLVGKYGYSEVLAVQTESNRLAAVASAARDGKLDVMKQLFKGDRERFTGTQRIIRAAVQSGHKGVVQWLRQHVDFEERYAWTFSPRVGRTRPRGEDDMPFGMQMLLGFGRRRLM
ncbi:hypothetical protein PHYSODRAFT_292902 [Phytophthora sojae]|uniref:Ankyrin repeat protein n=1 Tax=Phytophthora sojae (strain P6497) TaxID=1094619 RepID=G4YI08_PHYSP|nr:hypothetical protein PHYSODRAFT_292902 [Phytophthora sojae]EGZ26595.1 hypothetical protein PHYSODRAFT_292902 [Phytophthora sojae]|eukprot:XP_009513870.1 hypothetical protein PHYSODRAFT_292902 [Phytophthora sojae]